MTDDVGNLILERMRRLDDRMSTMEGTLHDIGTRMTAVEEHLGGMFISLTGVHNRLDRLTDRVERIERRLDLTDAK